MERGEAKEGKVRVAQESEGVGRGAHRLVGEHPRQGPRAPLESGDVAERLCQNGSFQAFPACPVVSL